MSKKTVLKNEKAPEKLHWKRLLKVQGIIEQIELKGASPFVPRNQRRMDVYVKHFGTTEPIQLSVFGDDIKGPGVGQPVEVWLMQKAVPSVEHCPCCQAPAAQISLLFDNAQSDRKCQACGCQWKSSLIKG